VSYLGDYTNDKISRYVFYKGKISFLQLWAIFRRETTSADIKETMHYLCDRGVVKYYIDRKKRTVIYEVCKA